MVVNEIFLGSGASITKVPELDILIKTATTGTVDTITIHSDFTDNFSLVNNLYVGCTLKKYNTSSKAYESIELQRIQILQLHFSHQQI